MKYLIDTSICIYIMNNRPANIIQKFKKMNVGEVGVSAITVSELQSGVAKSQQPKKNQNRLNEFISPLVVLPYNIDASKIYGEICYNLEKKGELISPLDILIASHALSEDLIIVTNNDKKLTRIENIKVENWVKQ